MKDKILIWTQRVTVTISIIAIAIIMWFDCTHTLWESEIWENDLKAIDASFSIFNIDYWFWYALLILIANIGVYVRIKNFGQGYDFFYVVRCMFGIYMSIFILALVIPWTGHIIIWDEDMVFELIGDYYAWSSIITIFFLPVCDIAVGAMYLRR